MTPERWRRVREVFAAAEGLAAGERKEFLDQECVDDQDLQAEVESLLDAAARSKEFLARDQAGTHEATRTQTHDGRAEDPFVGRRLDAYRVVRRIGRGGMGSVYLAVRADETFERRVAIKVVSQSLEGEEMLRRFRTERQILAALDHPHIAKLLDGGTTPEGLPYLVMEYVEGTPVDRYCDEHELSIRERIQLFRDLCDAVQFAHRNLVIHRDLKPANVLVDQHGRLELLDFGIAKLLNPELARSDVAPTAASFSALTPEYASPEQLASAPVTTATDVYSLGVVLHRLLTGGSPYRIERGAPAEIVRAICDEPPRRASDTAAGLGLGKAWVRRLRGDLDSMLHVALDKNPNRRYGSAEQLSEDLARFLDGRPVSARPATWRYRAGKLIRRHPWGISATAALVAASLVFAGLTARQNAEVERQRDLAEQSKELLVSLFESADPVGFKGREPTLREVLERGTTRLENELSARPLERAELLGVLGVVYRRLGDVSTAARLLEQALELQERNGSDDIEALCGLRNRLAEVRAQEGDLEIATSLYRQTLAELNDEPPGVVAATAFDGLGKVLQTQRDLEGAETYLERALDARTALLGPEHLDTLGTKSSLAINLYYRGAFDESERLHQQVLEQRERTLGRRHVETAQSLSDLAFVQRALGRPEQALELFEQAADVRTELLGSRHPQLATTLNGMAGVLEALRRDDEAAARYRQALAIYQEAYGPEHWNVAATRNNLANVQRRAGLIEEAADLYRQAADVMEKVLGAGHPNTATVRVNQARMLLTLGRPGEAEPLLLASLPVIRTVPGAASGVTATYLAETRLAAGDAEGAAERARSAIELFDEAEQVGEWHRAAARVVLARALLTTGEAEEARDLAGGAITALEEATASDAASYLAMAREVVGGAS